MAAYAVLADLSMAMPPPAYSSVPVGVQQACLDARNAYADDKMRARYRLPLGQPYPSSIVRAIVDMAAFDIICRRGFNPASAADANLRMRYDMAVKYFDDVERQRAHPIVVENAAPGTVEYDAPEVLSKPRQGWTSPADEEYYGAPFASWTRRR